MILKKLLLFISLILSIIVGLSFTQIPKITVKGSDTMVILSQKWAEVYISKHPGIRIQVSGGGTGVGFAALINGTTQIANASRPIKPYEIQKIKSNYDSKAIEIACAKDGLSIFLNKSNPINELTVDEIAKIFSGEINNWKQVKGPDVKIQLYGRESSSGTFEYFKEHIINGDFAPECKSLPGTAAIVNAIKKDKYGIGYGGSAYTEGVKDCKVKKDSKSKGILPSAETIKNKTYPISRYLFMYLKEKPTGETKKFIDWILSAEGQQVSIEVGYYPLK